MSTTKLFERQKIHASRPTLLAVILCIYSFLQVPALGQATHPNEQNWLYTGGLSVNFELPDSIRFYKNEMENPEINQLTQPAIWSDSSGKLVFYADQNHVWNGNGELIGDFDIIKDFGIIQKHSFSQMIVVPKNISKGMYYIFALEGSITSLNSIGKLYYHIVDMKANGGKGSIVSKNNLVYEQLHYNLTGNIAVASAGCRGYWLACNRWADNRMLSFLITDSVVSKEPVVSDLGVQKKGLDGTPIGFTQIKFSRQITKALVKVTHEVSDNQYIGSSSMLMDFNPITGYFKPLYRIFFRNFSYNYFCHEISPDGTYLYQAGSNIVSPFTSNFVIRQYNLINEDSIDIVNSAKESNFDTQGNGFLSSMTLSPFNQLIITSNYLTDTINANKVIRSYYTVIEMPNLPCPDCKIKSKKFVLSTSFPDVRFDFFPNFLRGNVVPDTALQVATTGCVADSVQPVLTGFQYAPPSYTWHFGNGDSIVTTTPTVPAHKYSQPGNYKLSVRSGECRAERSISVHPHPGTPAPGSDTTLCQGDTLMLDATPADTFTTVTWSTGSQAPLLPVSSPGIYTASFTNACATTTSQIAVDILYRPVPPFASDDTLLCAQPYALQAGNPGFSHLWNTGDTTALLPVNEDGKYYVITSNNCFERTDSIQVSRYTRPIGPVEFPDTAICSGDTLLLSVPYRPATAYMWQGGKPVNDTLMKVNSPGIYSMALSNKCEEREARAEVSVIPTLPPVLPADTVICGAGEALLPAGSADNTYQWNTGSTDNQITVDEDGTYSVTTSNGCFTRTDSIRVTFRDRAEQPTDANVITPNGDGVNDRFVPMPVDVPGYSLEIINRWGAQIYRSNNRSQGWEASGATDGTYFYRMSYINCRGEKEEQKGWVEIRR